MDDAGREERIRDLLPLVRRLAARLRRMVPRADLGDLIGDGNVGLVRAVDAFDTRRGTSLEHYARKVIVGTMLNGLRRMDPASERARRTLREGERERYRLAMLRGRMPSSTEMAHCRPALARAEYAVYRALPLSLDAPLPPGERGPLDLAGDPASIVSEDQERAYLRTLLNALPDRERRLMLAHYYGRTSLRRIGAAFSISGQRASQLHIAAIARLRKALDAAPR
ncbi:MAG TPA: sigma-70 family RNA polymerase sigma factor [Candidatus Tyrphobacter sp.]